MLADQRLYYIQVQAERAFYALNNCSTILSEMISDHQIHSPDAIAIETKAGEAAGITTDLIAYLRSLPVPFIPKEEQDA